MSYVYNQSAKRITGVRLTILLFGQIMLILQTRAAINVAKSQQEHG